MSGEATAWWPSPFGPDDQLGMLNRITDATRAQALGLVRSGRLYDLGWVLDELAPVFPGRYFRQTLVTTAHHSNGGGLGANRVNWITEQIAGTQQPGTHLDALCHLQIGDRSYNGWSVAELAGAAGVRRLGVETVPQIVARGWLVDVAPLDPGKVIGVPDIDPAPGEAVLFHTGWGEHWYDADLYMSASRGPAWRSRIGWCSAVLRSPGATPGATARSRPRIPSGRSRCPSSSTRATACSSSRTSTPPNRARRRARVRADPGPPQAARRERGVDLADRAHLGRPVEHYDVIIIGSGAGGGTLAHRLAPSGKRILLLERGGYLPRELENWDSEAVFGRERYVTAERWYDKHGVAFRPHAQYFVGANTKVYAEVLLRLRERDFREVQHHGGVSPAWPITYADLKPYYAQAERLYLVHGQAGEDPTEPPRSGPFPSPAISHEPRIQRLHDDLVRAGHRPFHLPVGIDLDKSDPEIAHNCGTVRFGTDSKRSALDLNCKAHDLDTLYVVDTSFFPSSSAVNPGLTTIANALRVGDHLLQRLGVPSAVSGETRRIRAVRHPDSAAARDRAVGCRAVTRGRSAPLRRAQSAGCRPPRD